MPIEVWTSRIRMDEGDEDDDEGLDGENRILFELLGRRVCGGNCVDCAGIERGGVQVDVYLLEESDNGMFFMNHFRRKGMVS